VNLEQLGDVFEADDEFGIAIEMDFVVADDAERSPLAALLFVANKFLFFRFVSANDPV